ncbi:MAG: hypothetical protein Athens101410_720 [Parcubacteria group bacterium Athens1014_10]|nr:MAG: hypothetical protein Athens101410_720 [Parcubacteria group bacterium Athens1014_10]TSD04474.1 MAG: hypothetical protein Athens071412_765 [Parcubacteria group bacterium Athens0714_12]
MQIKNKKETFKILLITIISVFLIVIIVKAATTIGTNIVTGGTLDVSGLTTLGAATSTSATSTKYIMVGSAFTLPSAFNYDGDLSVSSDLVVNNKATSTVALWVGSAGTANNINLIGGDLYVQNDTELDGALYVTGNAVISGTASTTSAIFSGNATTTGNMVIGYNKQATTGATTTLTIGSYDGGAAGNGTCLKLRQGGAWIYCVPSLLGISCSATSCE